MLQWSTVIYYHMGMVGICWYENSQASANTHERCNNGVDPAEKQLLSQGTTTSLPLASSSSISSRPSNPVPPVTKKPGPVMPFQWNPPHPFHSNSIIFTKFTPQCTVFHHVFAFAGHDSSPQWHILFSVIDVGWRVCDLVRAQSTHDTNLKSNGPAEPWYTMINDEPGHWAEWAEAAFGPRFPTPGRIEVPLPNKLRWSSAFWAPFGVPLPSVTGMAAKSALAII